MVKKSTSVAGFQIAYTRQLTEFSPPNHLAGTWVAEASTVRVAYGHIDGQMAHCGTYVAS